jgi:hypothetical protein
MALSGMSAKSVPPAVSDPTAHVNVQIEAVCIQLGIPVRVFKGSERGELASSQDDAAWNDRLRQRQRGYITPRIIVPFVDRLVGLGVLPEPEEYFVEWPDLDSQTDAEKAAVLAQRTGAYAAYVGGGVESVVPPLDYMTRFDGMDEEEAGTILEEAAKMMEDKQEEEELAQQEQLKQMQRQQQQGDGELADAVRQASPPLIKGVPGKAPFAKGVPGKAPPFVRKS